MLIPKKIHQIAKNSEIPKRWADLSNQLQKLHPDWSYHCWNTEEIIDLCFNSYPNYFDFFKDLSDERKRNVGKLFILHHEGGMVVDHNYELIRSFDLLDRSIILPLYRSLNFGDGDIVVGEAFIASAPDLPFWLRAMDEYAEHGIYKMRTLLTNLYKDNPDSDVFTPDRTFFYPLAPKNKESYLEIVKSQKYFGILHDSKSWRAPRWKKWLTSLPGIEID